MFYVRVYTNTMCCLTVDAPTKMIMETFSAITDIQFIEILRIFYTKTYSTDVLIPASPVISVSYLTSILNRLMGVP